LWDTLAFDTPNDGAETVFVAEPISNTCRVRVSAIDAEFVDVSDGDFAIVSSQGYLALMRDTQPNTAVLNWNAGIMECPETALEVFHLKNFGNEAITVYRAENVANPSFSRVTNCPLSFTLAAGEMSACDVSLGFAPSEDGSYFDTLLIRTNASNAEGLYVRIPIEAAQTRTPATPIVVITASGRMRSELIGDGIGGVRRMW
jgi:hypothetical protein